MRRYSHLSVIAAFVLFLVVVCSGQTTSAKKSHVFHGKVEAVDPGGKTLRVNGEKVEGWMAAMTMDYKVDNPEVLKKLKAGDQIMATVYDDDPLLHNVQIMSAAGSKK